MMAEPGTRVEAKHPNAAIDTEVSNFHHQVITATVTRELDFSAVDIISQRGKNNSNSNNHLL